LSPLFAQDYVEAVSRFSLLMRMKLVEEPNMARADAGQIERVRRKFAVALDARIPPLPNDGLVEVDNSIVAEDPHYEMKADGNPYMLRVSEDNGRGPRGSGGYDLWSWWYVLVDQGTIYAVFQDRA
jgi:hypothetical protein